MELTTEDAFLYLSEDNFEVRNYDDLKSRDWVTFAVPDDKKIYPLSVGGTDVTGLNYKNVTGVNIAGKVSYDPETRRLTLTNATIGEGGVAMGYGLGTTELMLEGSNTITGVDPMGCSLTANNGLIITSADGKGKLTIDNEDEDAAFGAFVGGSSTVISNCKLDFNSKGYGMTGMGTLTVDESTVRVKGEMGSMMMFSSVTLGEDMMFDKPKGCYYNPETMQLEVGGELVTSEVLLRLDLIPGDANYDGIVDAADIADIVNHIVGKPTSTGKFKEEAADLNSDETVNTADIAKIVNIIMGK